MPEMPRSGPIKRGDLIRYLRKKYPWERSAGLWTPRTPFQSVG